MFHIQQARRFDEDRARFYGAEITLAIGYLHSLKVILRSVKVYCCAKGYTYMPVCLSVADPGVVPRVPVHHPKL